MTTCRIVAHGDASFANLRDRGSQGGYLIFLVDDNGFFCPLSWQSKRIHRVVGCTLAAECLAINSAADAAIHLRAIISELAPSVKAPIHVFSDNESLVSNAHSSTPVTGKRLQIDIAILRDMLKQELAELRWIPSAKNLADCLTKAGASLVYMNLVLSGNCCFDLRSGSFIEK